MARFFLIYILTTIDYFDGERLYLKYCVAQA